MPPESDSTDDRSGTGRDGGTRRRAVLAGVGVVAAGGVVAVGRRATATETATFDGLDHRALGDATLSTESGSLVATLGSDGSGVATDTERAIDWTAALGSTIGNMPVGSSLRVEAVGTMEGDPGQVAGALKITSDDSSYRITGGYDTTTMSGDLVVEVLDGEESVVAEPLGQASLPIAEDYFELVRPDPDDFDDIDLGFGEHLVHGAMPESNGGLTVEDCHAGVRNRTGRNVEFVVNGRQVSGDRARLIEGSSGDDHEVWYTTEMRVTGTGLDEIVLDAEGTVPGATFAGLPNRLAGDATVQRTTGTLEVRGVTADDGFGVDLGSAAGFAAGFDGVALEQSGSVLAGAATGTVDGVPGQHLGTARLSTADAGLELVADFTPLGTDSVRVEVLRDGEVAGSAVVAAGEVVPVGGGPLVVGTEVVPGTPPGYAVGLDPEAEVLLGDEAVVGDRVRLFPSQPGATVDDLEAFDLRGSELGDLVLVDETATT